MCNGLYDESVEKASLRMSLIRVISRELSQLFSLMPLMLGEFVIDDGRRRSERFLYLTSEDILSIFVLRMREASEPLSLIRLPTWLVMKLRTSLKESLATSFVFSPTLAESKLFLT